MNKQQVKLHHSPTLLKISLCFMICSFMLPGFYANYEAIYGYQIFLYGLLFGWAVVPGGWAVYANLFYMHIVFRLSRKEELYAGPRILATIIMMLLACCTFFFSEFDWLLISRAMVISWGWGAVLWGISLILLCAAQRVDLSRSIKQQVFPWLGVSALILLGVGILKYSQWQRANDDEKKRYLPFGAAFTTETLSGIPYIPLPKEVPVSADTLFAIEGELNSKAKLNTHIDENGNTLRDHDLPDRFQYGSYIWEKYTANNIWFLKPSSQTADYTLRIRPGTHQAEFSLSTPTKTLWKAPAVIAEDYPHFSSGIYPDYDSSLRNLFENYDNLSKDQKDQAPLPDHYPSELASLSCPITSGIKVKSVPDVFKWQNTFMWLQRNSESDPQIQHYQSFCSTSYAILLSTITNIYAGYS
ncbi:MULTISPECIES: hypothetical protein [unclassified Neisseria]|uniref:hypothetical protein n=1 Tax=unclassified Neisseria TaxID=2623750 RepID=UPI002665F2E9|nr:MULTISPECIES: hypothetical protein [unclassified Neisseria]MDO1509857.1 hypothetical protein [Neisseria sp. MVDL19-042950]MDO1516054.1 hypothetical protein [Neisseria sp. MVDL18-041461]MDO1563170.1 hypothetical protein [Neisseria sp. MVDL20-010259]